MKIIIQAGGKGTRLEGLTRNKPKCIVPVDNLPIIFYAFKKFPNAEFKIIADYKTEILEKYLNAFASEYNYKIIKAEKKGTASGIKTALEDFDNDEQVIIMWCDLILADEFAPPRKTKETLSEFLKTLNAAGHLKMENLLKNHLKNTVLQVYLFLKIKNTLKTLRKKVLLLDGYKNKILSLTLYH